MSLFKLNFVIVSLAGIMLSACAKNSTGSKTPNVAIRGHYEQNLPDGSTDILLVKQDGSMSLELTRQVVPATGLALQGDG